MAYDNYLQNGFDNRPIWNTPGSKRILFVKSDAIQQLVYAEKDVVDTIILRVGVKWNLFNDLDNLSYVLTPDTGRNGTLYGVEIAFTTNVQTTQKNRLFDAMRNTDLTAIVEDRNYRWWLVGLEQPLRLTTQEQKIDNDTNQYLIKLSGKQRQNVKEMSAVFTGGLTNDMFTGLVDGVDGATLDVKVATSNGGQNGGGSTQFPNNFQTTITAPPTNYVVLDSIGVVFASAGTSILLPSTGINGQQHTVKDYTGLASTAAITVSGNGHLIDGFASFVLNTDFGAVTFTFNNNAWLVSSFVN